MNKTHNMPNKVFAGYFNNGSHLQVNSTLSNL